MSDQTTDPSTQRPSSRATQPVLDRAGPSATYGALRQAAGRWSGAVLLLVGSLLAWTYDATSSATSRSASRRSAGSSGMIGSAWWPSSFLLADRVRWRGW